MNLFVFCCDIELQNFFIQFYSNPKSFMHSTFLITIYIYKNSLIDETFPNLILEFYNDFT